MDLGLLVNPAAGRGRAPELVDAVVRRFTEAGRGVHVLAADSAAQSEVLAIEAVAHGARGLVAMGGDGMVHTALQALATTGVPLGVIPFGTGNDVAQALGLPRHDPLACVDRVLAGRTLTWDLGRAGDRWFVTVLAAGFDAVVNERANQMTWPKGQMRYNLATIAELRTFRPLSYTLDLDGEVRHLDAMLVAVGNGPSFGGGLRIAEGAQFDDGLLDVVLIKPISTWELIRTYPKLFHGTHITHPQYERHRVRRVTVASPGIVGYADGERIGALPLTVSSVPAALEVFA